MSLLPPVISEFDPLLESEGSIDPLGLQAAYERLADKILPAITVRMTRPRFLTAMAVGARVCEEWEEEDLAADGVTPAWLIFEWFVIESFVRSKSITTGGERIAGIQKVTTAIRDFGHLSAPAYLKTPKVFGFTGIFKRLAIAAGVLTDDFALDHAGYELVRAWEQDRDLAGFLDGREGAGAKFRNRLRVAVEQGMQRAATTAQNAAFWDELAGHLDPNTPGAKERGILYQVIRSGSLRDPCTSELVARLEERGSPISWVEEAGFLRTLPSRVPPELRSLLSAIDVYENLCRPVTDGFNLIRHLSAVSSNAPIGPKEFAGQDAARRLVPRVAESAHLASECQELLDREPAVRDLADHFRDTGKAEDLFERLVARHNKAQSDKPPHGKRAWLERSRGTAVIVRPAYGLPTMPEDPPPYVHDYRTPTLSRFLSDLGRFS
jgi:hypothetical protein